MEHINYVTRILRCFIFICSMDKFNITIWENDNDDDHDDDDDDDDDDNDDDDDYDDDYAFTDTTLTTRGVRYV